MSKNLRWKLAVILGVTGLAVWSFTPPSRKISLGLDLQGGVHFLLAVQTDEGLVVPVLRAADQKSLDELSAESARLAEGARAGSLGAEELRGSTFTVTSAGRLGGLFATPLVNHPEVGILGLHRIGPRPAVVDGQVVAREIGWLSCTFDHRVVDGARASEFLLAVIERLEAA